MTSKAERRAKKRRTKDLKRLKAHMKGTGFYPKLRELTSLYRRLTTESPLPKPESYTELVTIWTFDLPVAPSFVMYDEEP